MDQALVETVLTIEAVPPSLNVTARSPWPYRRAKDEWEQRLLTAILGSGMRPCRSVLAEGHIVFPDRRKRDQGNFRFMLEKALGDALQQAAILEDDDWDSFQFANLTYEHMPRVSRTRLILLPDAI